MPNQAYRKHLKRDLESIVRGIDVNGFVEESFLSLMRVFRENLRLSINQASVTPMMHFLYENFEKSSARLDGKKLACRKGCSHCCNIWTDAYAPEIFFVAKQIPKTADLSEPSLITRTGVFSANLSLDQRETFPIPCPLLVDDACSVHRLRPLNCRTAVSLDEEACKKSFLENKEIEIPVPLGWNNLGQMYSMALKGALHNAGLACEAYEWYTALHLAANKPDLEKRWLRGENVFSGAPVATTAEPFTHPFWRSLYDRAFAS